MNTKINIPSVLFHCLEDSSAVEILLLWKAFLGLGAQNPSRKILYTKHKHLNHIKRFVLVKQYMNICYLYARWYVIYYANSFAVRVSREWMRNDMVLHLPRWLVARLHTIYRLARGTLQAAIFVAIVVHGYQALQMILMATLCQSTHWLCTGYSTHTWAFITRRPS